MRNGLRLRSWPVCWWARVLCFTLCIGLLLLPSPIFALNPSERLNSIESRLQNIVIYSQQLEDELQSSQDLTQQKQQIINEQLTELAALRIELESWKASDEQKAKRIAELLNIINELEKRLQQLSESCENIVKPLREALKQAEKEIHRQKIEKWLFTIGGTALAGYVGYRIGRAVK